MSVSTIVKEGYEYFSSVCSLSEACVGFFCRGDRQLSSREDVQSLMGRIDRLCVHCYSYDEVDEKVRGLFRQFSKEMVINESNYDIVEEHLVQWSKGCRPFLLAAKKHVKLLRGNDSCIQRIRGSLLAVL